MLSVVKMDLETDMRLSYNEHLIKTEMLDIVEEAIPHENERNTLLDKLEQIPLVYTTRLDDMKVLKLYPVQSRPKEVTDIIIKESKPPLRNLPSFPKTPRRNKKRFEEIKVTLSNIYASSKTEDIQGEIDIPDASTIQIVLNSIKTEVLDTPNSEPKDTCPYSELLKLCKPCSVVLPQIDSQFIIHGGQVLKANRVVKPVVPTSIELSSDEEQPLITQKEVSKNVASKLKVKNAGEIGNSAKRKAKIVKLPLQPTMTEKTGDTYSESILPKSQRILRNSLVEIIDAFSKEFHLYYADNDSNLLDYFTTTTANLQSYDLYRKYHCGASRYVVQNCCWIKKDEYIRSLYPKVLVYPNSRFMRRPHPCKPGACRCCCRKKENVKKPDLLIADEYTLENQKSFEKEDKEIQDLEDEIDKSIISIKNTRNFYSTTDWLQKLLDNSANKQTKTVIQKALTYEKPRPKIVSDNRRLYTLKGGKPQTSVIIFGNFAKDVTEIYEINAYGQIESYLKTTCFNNARQPGIKKLLKRPDAITESVCCWFKREDAINKLQQSNTLPRATVMFMKTNHNCQVNECTCCCKPQTSRKLKLVDVTIPKRFDWSSNINAHRQEKSSVKFPQLASSGPSLLQRQLQKPQRAVPFVPKPSTSQNDDCQITSIMTSPMLRPAPQNPTIPTAGTVPVAGASPDMSMSGIVDDELSQEVNALITSILDRFKDVRLTINSEGKVSASLNTPINTLSTVELKVLANILSFAQNQVNSLGFNVSSGMSLSNIINLKVGDVNNTLDPKSVYKAFGQNVNLNNIPQNTQRPQTKPNNTKTTPPTSHLPKVPELPNVPQTYNFFTNSTSVRNQHFNEAFSTFINSKMESNRDVDNNETVFPVIEDVFSIKEEPEETDSSTTVWYRKPVGQQSVSTLLEDKSEKSNSNQSRKRTEDTESSTLQTKKIRVLPPENLSAESQSTTVAQLPVQRIVGVGGSLSGVPVLSNNNFKVIGQTQATSNLMPVILSPPVAQTQPILIINPLNTPNLINTGGTVSVPYTNNSMNVQNVATVTHPVSNTPVLTNPTDMFSFINTENNNEPSAENIIISNVTSEAEFINEDVTDDLMEENNEDVDSNVEFREDDPEAENDGVEISEDIEEVENCVDNETDEEDCILGF